MPAGQPSETEAQRLARTAKIEGHEQQTVSVTDVISEGPIWGLIGGVSGVYLNNNKQADPALSGGRYVGTGVSLTVTNGSNTATINNLGVNLNYSNADTNINKLFAIRSVQTGTITYDQHRMGHKVRGNSFTNPGSLVSGTKKVEDHIPVRFERPNGEFELGRFYRYKYDNLYFQEGYFSGGVWKKIKTYEMDPSGTNTARFHIDKYIKVTSIVGSTVTFSENFTGTSGTYEFDDLGPDLSNASMGSSAGFIKNPGTQVQFRPGTLNQAPFHGHGGIGSTAVTQGVNFDLEKSNSYPDAEGKSPGGAADPTVLIGSSSAHFNLSQNQLSAVDTIKIGINYPNGLRAISGKGNDQLTYIRYKITIDFKRPGETDFDGTPFEITEDNDYGFRIHKNKTVNALTIEEVIDLEKYRPFIDFKVTIERRDSDNDPGFKYVGEYFHDWTNVSTSKITTLTSIMKEKLNHPYTAMAKISYSTRNFQSIPDRTYLTRGMLIKVPSNYVTREESATGVASYNRNVTTGDIETDPQDWDGAFREKRVYTNNPAWIFYDMVTQNRYGLGDFVAETDIDKYALYRIGKYCDEEVDDGSGLGTTVPRYTLNTYLTKATDAFKVLKDMASNFLTMIYYLDGKILPIQDSPSGPVYAFSKANVVQGKFAYESTGTKTRINQIIVKWNNPDNNYELEPIIVEDRANIVKQGKIVSQTATAFGCTNESQAIRFGRWKLWTALNQQEVCSFSTGIQGNYIIPGDVITVQDADRNSVRYSGRISGRLTKGLTETVNYAARNQIASNADGFDATQRSQPTFMEGIIQLPTSVTQDRVIFEYGGTTAGTWIGVRDVGGVDTLTFRAGDGSVGVTATNTNGVYKEIPIADIPEFDGKLHTVSWAFDPSAGTGRMWIDGRLLIDEATTDGSAFTNSTWAGANVGGWGQGYGGIAGNFAGTQWIDTISSNLSIYANQTPFYPTLTYIPLDSEVPLNTGSDYTLSVVVTKPGAFAQEDMTVNGVDYEAGDLIEEAFIDTDGDGTYSLCQILTASAAANAYAAATGNTESLKLDWKESIRVETRNVSTASGSDVDAVSLSSALTVVPNSEAIWVLNETISGAEVASGGKLYKVLSIIEGENGQYDIAAVEYYDEKYGAIETNFTTYITDRLFPAIKAVDNVPPPKSASFTITYDGSEAGDTVEVYWDRPDGSTRQVRQPDGTLADILVEGTTYEHYSHTEITHELPGLLSPLKISGENTVTLRNVPAGTHKLALKTVNTRGISSESVILDVNVTQEIRDANTPRYPGGVPYGGFINTGLRLTNDGSTDRIEFNKYNWEYRSPQFGADIVTNTSTDDAKWKQVLSGSFPTTADRTDPEADAFRTTDHYLLIDASDSADPLKLVKWQRGYRVSYWYDTVTGTDTGTVALTGTVSKSLYSPKIVGTGTAFTTELEVGMPFIAGSTVQGKVIAIYSDTVLFIDRRDNTSLTNFSGATTSNLYVEPDRDAIIGRVYKDSNGLKLETFAAIDSDLRADGVVYTDGETIESLQPNEAGADSTCSQINANIAIVEAAGGLTFNNAGSVKSNGQSNETITSAGGYFLGYNPTSTKYTFGVGNDVQNLIWDGTDLSVTGVVTAASGQIGGWTIASQGLYAGDISSASASAVTAGYIEGLGAAENAIVIHNQGSIHSKNFYINSDGSARFKGSVSAATGVFFGDLLEQSVGTNELAAGAVTADEIATGSIVGDNISSSSVLAVYEADASGSIDETTYAALDGKHDTYRIYAGDTSAGSAPFRVTKTGQVIANNLQLYDTSNNLYFDSNTGGFTAAALGQIASALANTRVFEFSEAWSDELNTGSPQADTFEKVELTASTDVTTDLKIPVQMFSATASSPYFGKINKPVYATVDVSTHDGSTIDISDINSPLTNTALGRDLKVGEIVRLNLENVTEGVTLTGVANAENALTNAAFASTTPVAGPTSINFIYFRITGTGTFTATINVPGLNNIPISITGTDAKPDTQTAARNKIPSSFSFQLDRNADTVGGTTTNVISSSTYTAVYATTSDSNEYFIKTVVLDEIGDSTIHSTVGVENGVGAVDASGNITRSATNTLASGAYYFHSTLSVTGGETAKQPSTRIFEVSTPSTSNGFIISGNEASQSDIQAALTSLSLSGDMSVPSAFTITPDSAGSVTIDGDLNVTGTTTTTNQAELEVGDKTILVAANATTAAAVSGAGLLVDRSALSAPQTNASILWDQTNSEWEIYTRASASSFRSAIDGTEDAPAYIFGARNQKTGLYASNAASGDRISIATKDGSNVAHSTHFDSLGITSHQDFILGSDGKFKNSSLNWTAQTYDDNFDFQFQNAGGTPLMHLDAATGRLGLGTAAPAGEIHIRKNTLTSMPTVPSFLDGLVIENNDSTGISIHTPTNKNGYLSFGDTTSNRGAIRYNHGTDSMIFSAGGIERVTIDNTAAMTISDASAAGHGSNYSHGSLDIRNTHAGLISRTEGATLTFSTQGISSSLRQTRAGIFAGPTEDSTGYGFIALMTSTASAQSTSNAVYERFKIHSDPVKGTQMSLNTHGINNNRPEEFIHFQSRSSETDADCYLKLQGTIDLEVGQKVGIKLAAGDDASGSRISAERHSSDDGRSDLVFSTDVGVGGVFEVMRMSGTDVGIGVIEPKARLHVKDLGISTQNTILNTTTEITVGSFNVNNFRSGKFMVQMEDVGNSNHLIAEILAVYEPSTQTAEATEYGVVFTGSSKGVTFTVDVVAATTVVLKATCDATSTNRRFTVATMSLGHTA